MRRFLPSLLAGCLLLTAGCLNVRDKEEKEPFTAADWKEATRDDARRMLSEDQLAGPPGVLKKVGNAIGDQIERIYNYITGDTPFKAAKDLLDPSYPDRRRQAVVYFSDRVYGRQEPYVKYYMELARTDNDHLVRAMAIRALNRARARGALTVFVAAMEDQHELVRLEAAKALANVPDPSATAALTRHLQPTFEVVSREGREDREESTDVRVACADALRSFKDITTAQSLVRALRDQSFGVSWQARRSLMLMTGKDYRFDQAAWLTYLSGTEKPFG
jgi:hypothetical protein